MFVPSVSFSLFAQPWSFANNFSIFSKVKVCVHSTLLPRPHLWDYLGNNFSVTSGDTNQTGAFIVCRYIYRVCGDVNMDVA